MHKCLMSMSETRCPVLEMSQLSTTHYHAGREKEERNAWRGRRRKRTQRRQVGVGQWGRGEEVGKAATLSHVHPVSRVVSVRYRDRDGIRYRDYREGMPFTRTLAGRSS